MEKLSRQVKILQLYAVVMTLVLATILVYVITENRKNTKEITAERINIIEPGGKLRMVISNKESQHPGRVDNKDLSKRDRPAGMIFFNDDGDECGGLVYDGDKKSASMTYSIDQYKNDQVMQLQYAQDNDAGINKKSYGLRLWDRNDAFTLSRLVNYTDSLKKLNDTASYSTGIAALKSKGMLGRERLFIGKNKAGEVGLFLDDEKGVPRLEIFINASNQPVIRMLDEKGNIVPAK